MKKEKLVIMPHQCNWDALGYNYTKPTRLVISFVDSEYHSGFINQIIDHQYSFWSRILKDTVNELQNAINIAVSKGGFEQKFNEVLDTMLDENNLKENGNFSRKIFTDDGFMTSSVYKQNKNHMLRLYVDPETKEEKYICAVYSAEVVWILYTLVTTLADLGVYTIRLEVEYYHTENKDKQEEEVSEDNNTELKEILNDKIKNVVNEIMEIKYLISKL